MKHFKRFGFILAIFAFSMMLCAGSAMAQTYGMIMEDLVDENSAALPAGNLVARGGYIMVTFTFDNSADSMDVAGVAFTTNFDDPVLSFPQPNSDGTPVDWPDGMASVTTTPNVDWNFNDGTSTSDTFRVNAPDGEGKLYFAAASIDESTGSAKNDTSSTDSQTIVTYLFQVKENAPFGDSTISAAQTMLYNPSAGYGDANDATETPEGVPIYVGAYPQGDPNFDDPTTAFEVLLDSFGAGEAPTATFKVDQELSYNKWLADNGWDSITELSWANRDGDYDNDGTSNWDEYLAGSDPTTAGGATGQSIPLVKGWNLISFGVNKCFYTSSTAPTGLIDGVQTVSVDSLGTTVLQSIEGTYENVQGFQNGDAVVYVPPPLEYLSTMKYMTVGEGYWIKIKDSVTTDVVLQIDGNLADPTKSMTLNTGWNLVGYLGNTVYYDGTEPSHSLFPATATYTAATLSNVISFTGTYQNIQAFDGDAYVYVPPPLDYLSTLEYVGPGKGYWVLVNEAGDLQWSQP